MPLTRPYIAVIACITSICLAQNSTQSAAILYPSERPLLNSIDVVDMVYVSPWSQVELNFSCSDYDRTRSIPFNTPLGQNGTFAVPLILAQIGNVQFPVLCWLEISQFGADNTQGAAEATIVVGSTTGTPTTWTSGMTPPLLQPSTGSIATVTSSVSVGPTTTNSFSSTSPSSSPSNLSNGAKAGIGVGAVLAGFLVLGALIYLIKRNRRLKKAENVPSENRRRALEDAEIDPKIRSGGSAEGPQGPQELGANLAEQRVRQRKAIYTDAVESGKTRFLQPIKSRPHSYNLVTVDLADKPIYDALSYTWGNEADDETIELNGKLFPVTPHLKAALTALGRGSSPLYWIDAVCIDQTSDAEKNLQVRQMTRIYESARKVLVWLGESGDGSERAFDLLDGFGSPSGDQDFAAAVVQSFLSQPQANKWTALGRLLARPWWTRAWIFQELIVSSEAEVWCGQRSCSWETFATLAFVIERCQSIFLSGAVADVMANHQHVYNLALYRRQRKFLCPPSLSEALQCRRRSGATDPRDKVFSLLGVCREEQALPRQFRDGTVLDGELPSPPQSLDLQIKYEKSHTAADVFKGATRHIIRKTEHLDIVSACQNPQRKNGIPSWAPDWSTPRVNGPLVVPDSWGRIYSSGGDQKAVLREGLNSDEIILTGLFVDTIHKVESVRLQGWDEVQYPWALLAMACAKALPDGRKLNSALSGRDLDAHCQYITGERISDAFLRTCVADRIEEFRVEPPGLRHVDSSRLTEDNELRGRETIARLDATEARRFAITKTGFMGLVPLETKPGDKLAVLAGADVPFILRRGDGSDGWNVIVGECYVHGLMYGEVFDLGRHRWSGPEHKGLKWCDVRLR